MNYNELNIMEYIVDGGSRSCDQDLMETGESGKHWVRD